MVRRVVRLVRGPLVGIGLAAALSACYGAIPTDVPANSEAPSAPVATADEPPASSDSPTASDAAAESAPASLSGRLWWVAKGDTNVIGVLGEPFRLTVPGGWRVLGGTADTIVASEVAGDTSVVHFLAPTGGEVFPPVAYPGDLVLGQRAGDRVFASGFAPQSASDPGIAVISLADGSVKPLFEPAANKVDGSPIARSVVISESGLTLASSLCTLDSCLETSIWNTDTMSIIGHFDADPRYALAVSDEHVLLSDPGETVRGLTLVNLKTSESIWRIADGIYPPGYLAGERVVTVEVIEGGSPPQRLLLIDLDGAKTDLGLPASDGPWHIWTDLSNASTIVLSDQSSNPTVDGGVLSAATVDIAARTFAEDGLVVRVP